MSHYLRIIGDLEGFQNMNERLLPQSKIIPDEVRHAVSINSSAREIFHYISTTEGWNGWFTSDMSLDLQPGGRIIFHWKNWGADKLSAGDYGTILECIPDKLIEFTWHPDQPEYTTKVAISLVGESLPCIVRVLETGFADTPEGLRAMIQSAAGWGEALTLLKMYIEHGVSLVVREN